MPTYTEEQALAILRQRTGAGEQPTLSDADLAELLTLAKRTDIDTRTPDDPNWIPTWDLAAAAAEGWRWKGGRVAAKFDINADGNSLTRSQAFAHCERMAVHWEAQAETGGLGIILPALPDYYNADPEWIVNR